MMPGPSYVYKCPNCTNLLVKESLSTGNTLGAQIYSDGKRIAPMLPEFPDLTKCKQCETIFWLSKQKEIGSFKWINKSDSDWPNADDADFLTINEYDEALKKGKATNKAEELFIRQRIWWGYNDRLRNDQPIFEEEKEEVLWQENLEKLLNLLDESKLNQKILIAEINRNLGNFQNCMELIQSIEDSKFDWLKEEFVEACKRKNRWVFRLN